jgi:hypothetical protein
MGNLLGKLSYEYGKYFGINKEIILTNIFVRYQLLFFVSNFTVNSIFFGKKGDSLLQDGAQPTKKSNSTKGLHQ